MKEQGDEANPECFPQQNWAAGRDPRENFDSIKVVVRNTTNKSQIVRILHPHETAATNYGNVEGIEITAERFNGSVCYAGYDSLVDLLKKGCWRINKWMMHSPYFEIPEILSSHWREITTSGHTKALLIHGGECSVPITFLKNYLQHDKSQRYSDTLYILGIGKFSRDVSWLTITAPANEEFTIYAYADAFTK